MIKVFHLEPYYELHINVINGNLDVYSDYKKNNRKKLSIYISNTGYKCVKINNKQQLVHHLVAKYIIGDRPNGLVINHIDGNKLNNSPTNLEYVTIRENNLHAISIGIHISCDNTKMPTYIDGRTSDIKKYKKSWYLQNKERILAKAKNRYREFLEQKEGVYSLT